MHANARWVESSGGDLVPAVQMEDAVPGPPGILLLFSYSPTERCCDQAAAQLSLCLCTVFINTQALGTPTKPLRLAA